MATDSNLTRTVRIVSIKCTDLIKWHVFRPPDPYAVITIDGNRVHNTAVMRMTRNPVWHEDLDITVNDSTVITIEVFDDYLKGGPRALLGSVCFCFSDAFDFREDGESTRRFLFDVRKYWFELGSVEIHLQTISTPTRNPVTLWARTVPNISDTTPTQATEEGKDEDSAITHHDVATSALQWFYRVYYHDGGVLDSTWFHGRFLLEEWDKLLSNATAYFRHAIILLPENHEYRWQFISNLALSLDAKFQQMGDAEDLEEIIALHRGALKLDPEDRAMWTNDLATGLHMCFQYYRSPSDLDEAISLFRDALRLRPLPHPEHINALYNLADALRTRFEETGRSDDLTEAVALRCNMLGLPSPDPHRLDTLSPISPESSLVADTFEDFPANALSVHLANDERNSNDMEALETVTFAKRLHREFDDNRNLPGLETAILLFQRAFILLPPDHPDEQPYVTHLTRSIQSRFEETSQLEDIDEVIALHRRIVALNLENPSNSFSDLGSALHVRFQAVRQLSDLEESIKYNRYALELRPGGHKRSISLRNLASTLLDLADQVGNLDYTKEAIKLYEELLKTLPSSDPSCSDILCNLGTAFHILFDHTHVMSDLDESIRYHRKALDMTPNESHTRYLSLHNLADVLCKRDSQSNRLEDLAEAIKLQEEVVALLSASHLHRADALNSLGGFLFLLFEKQGGQENVEKAIALYREALSLPYVSKGGDAMGLNNLGHALCSLFDETKEDKLLEEAISLHRQALSISGPEKIYSLNNLSKALLARFRTLKRDPDLDEAIQIIREALLEVRVDHPIFSAFSMNWGSLLAEKYSSTTDQPQHLEDAMANYRAAVKCTLASPVQRCLAARQWARCADNSNHKCALEAYDAAIKLLPLLATQDLDVKRRQRILVGRSDGLGPDAAACAIRKGELRVAIELLEESRTVFWSQTLLLRTPLDYFRKRHPTRSALADRFESVSRELQQGSFRDTSRTLSESPKKLISMDEEVAYSRQLHKDWLECAEEIRQLDGFDDFLRRKTALQPLEATANYPVVILIGSKRKCSALLLRPRSIKYIPLKITYQQAEELNQKMQMAASSSGYRILRQMGRVAITPPTFQSVLASLWEEVVLPVIVELQLEKTQSPPRLWWYPTGPFTFLPLHAAGIYTGNGDKVFDFVVSSYTPTLSALHPRRPPTTANPFKVVVAITPDGAWIESGYQNPLKCTIDEVKKINNHIPKKFLAIFGAPRSLEVPYKFGDPRKPALVQEVVSHLQTASIAHFSCHGMQNHMDGFESSLFFDDGPLTMAKIMENPLPNAQLAFLAACQTATGEKDLPDEVINIAAALLFAGFRETVGTMWSVFDSDGPIITDYFYRNLFNPDTINSNDRPEQRMEAARALHNAVAELRDTPGRSFEHWVPFIHLGL